MPTNQLQQFERNNYFYGKLLTVRDFQLEQSYMNEKRSMLNRMVHGSGVISGLHLVSLDGSGIRLTPGSALDASGREIVVNTNQDIANIGKLTGYPPIYNGGILYLTLTYDETAREPVPAVSNTMPGQGGCESNKIRETFRLSLTEQAPVSDTGFNSIYRQTKTIFENEQFIIHRTVPRMANPGDIVEVELSVMTKLLIPTMLQVDIAEELPNQFSLLSYWKDGKVPFVLTNLPANTTRSQRYYARVGDIPTSLTIGGKVLINGVLYPQQDTSTLSIVDDRSLIRMLAEQYFAGSPGTGTIGGEGVVIAALTINNKEIITQIDESVRPFVYNNELLFQLMLNEKQRLPVLPTHASTHRSGGMDELNVDNLSGVLSDAQKVAVLDEGKALSPRQQLNFTGPGVTASEDASNKNRININITGQSAHALSHQDGNADEINVAGLSGLLADPQRIIVQDEGTALTARTKINFIGAGVAAVDDPTNSRINVTIPGSTSSAAQISTGTVTFQGMFPGESRLSPLISHQLQSSNVGIILAIVINPQVLGGGDTSLAASKSASLTSGAALTDTTTGTGGISTSPLPTPIPDPAPIPIPIPIYNPVRTGDVALYDPQSPLVIASYPTNSTSDFKISLKDRRPVTEGYLIDWQVRWWAVKGTIYAGDVVVPSGSPGGDTSLASRELKPDLSATNLTRMTTEEAPTKTNRSVKKAVVKEDPAPEPDDSPAES